MRLALFIILGLNLFGADFDCAIVGTSPIPLFEALYKHHLGQRVLILEASDLCGGAWKSIDVCGVARVDMGCHDISRSLDLNQFLEEYAGCCIVSCDANYYFSRGCFELIDNLLKRIRAAGIPLLMNCKVETVSLDLEKKEGILKTSQGVFTASKIVVTPNSSFEIEGCGSLEKRTNKFYHLYLLVQDPTPPRFSYLCGKLPGVSRMMNLTSFVGLNMSGQQLIVLQTHSEEQFAKAALFLEDLKKANLADPGAYLLKTESYTYEQSPTFRVGKLSQKQQPFFEVLNTSHLNAINTYVSKWKAALPPYAEGRP